MTVSERLRRATDKLYLRARHPTAWKADRSDEHDFDSLRGYKNALLYTYKRSGEAVPTPVWFGLAEGKLYFRTYDDALKVKRIRANPRVLVGPCDVRGKPAGPVVEGRARELEGEERRKAEAAIRSNFGLGRRLYLTGFSGRVPDAYVEVMPV